MAQCPAWLGPPGLRTLIRQFGAPSFAPFPRLLPGGMRDPEGKSFIAAFTAERRCHSSCHGPLVRATINQTLLDSAPTLRAPNPGRRRPAAKCRYYVLGSVRGCG